MKNLLQKDNEYLFSIIPQGVNVLVPSAYDDTLFRGEKETSDTPEQPLKVHPSGANFNHSDLVEKEKTNPKKEKKVKIRILEAGIDYLIGVNPKKGNSPVTIFVNEQTVLKKDGTKKKGINAIMVALKEGDYIKVSGIKTPEKSKILATRISVKLPPD